MKVWMWQRLYKVHGKDAVIPMISWTDDCLAMQEWPWDDSGWYWLCPKPCLVLVDRKYI